MPWISAGNRPVTSAEGHTVNPNPSTATAPPRRAPPPSTLDAGAHACGDRDRGGRRDARPRAEAGAADPRRAPRPAAPIDDICAPGRFAAVPSRRHPAVGEVLAFLARRRPASSARLARRPPGSPPTWRRHRGGELRRRGARRRRGRGRRRRSRRRRPAHRPAHRPPPERLGPVRTDGGRVRHRRSRPGGGGRPDRRARSPRRTASVGFGSVWVSQKLGDDVVRVDPDTGEILATIDVGNEPLKLQPADGRMWVRTTDAYVAIDAETNEVVASLPRPTSARRRTATTPSTVRCGSVTARVSIATTRPRSSGWRRSTSTRLRVRVRHQRPRRRLERQRRARASRVSRRRCSSIPATNRVPGHDDLPVDVGWPAVFDDTVFFGGDLNTRRGDRPRDVDDESSVELPDVVGGGGIVTDGTSIYVPTRGAQPWDVLVLDAETFEVTETLTPLTSVGLRRRRRCGSPTPCRTSSIASISRRNPCDCTTKAPPRPGAGPSSFRPSRAG